MEAIDEYRSGFTPSQYLNRPHLMAGVPLVAAETDSEAKRLSTSALQRHLRLIRRQPIFIPPPVDSMEGLWSDAEKFLVQSRTGVAVVGGPETVEHKLREFLQATGADELIFTSDLYDHERRLRSFQIGAEAMKRLAAESSTESDRLANR
jgi:alkanesulfonate monooxygenase SsuD/methylene tetrahydromethanopterin reductase-like flavin-dependent oxidoreductase (luciferase family)